MRCYLIFPRSFRFWHPYDDRWKRSLEHGGLMEVLRHVICNSGSYKHCTYMLLTKTQSLKEEGILKEKKDRGLRVKSSEF